MADFSSQLAQANARAQAARMQAKDPLAFTLILKDREIPVVAGHLTRSIDTVADQWTTEIPWTPDADPELDKLVRFRSYAEAVVYLGGNRQLTGRLYSVENELTTNGCVKRLEGASKTADLVDSSMSMDAVRHGYNPDSPISLTDRWEGGSVFNFCKAILPLVGFDVKCDPLLKDPKAFYTAPFPAIECQLTDTYAQVITKIAFQRGMLVTNDIYGNLYLTMPRGVPELGTMEEPLCTLREGDEVVTSWKLKVDGRQLWHEYIVYSERAGGLDLGTETDPTVPIAARSLSIFATLTDSSKFRQARCFQAQSGDREGADLLPSSLRLVHAERRSLATEQARDDRLQGPGGTQRVYLPHQGRRLRLHEGRLH